MTSGDSTHHSHNFQDLTGIRFTMLTSLSLAPQRASNGELAWVCRCDCGNVIVVPGRELRRQHKKSCGCSKVQLLGEASRRAAAQDVAFWVQGHVFPDGRILLPDDHVCLVDPEDVPLVSHNIWHILPARSGRLYARTGAKPRDLMHCLLMGRRPGFMTDHINGNGLDNRRANLRWATAGQNCANREKPIGASGSRYKGVTPPRNRYKGWRASITCNGVRRTVGPFATEEEAAREYDRLALEVFGEFALLNFPARSQP